MKALAMLVFVGNTEERDSFHVAVPRLEEEDECPRDSPP